MDKVLFFRSSSKPIILDEEEREYRRQSLVDHREVSLVADARVFSVRLEAVKKNRAGKKDDDYSLPDLTFTSPTSKLSSRNHRGKSLLRRRTGHSSIVLVRSDSQTDPTAKSNSTLVCIICMDRSRDALIRPCNHMVVCYACATLLLQRRETCPICRKKIDDVIRVYT